MSGRGRGKDKETKATFICALGYVNVLVILHVNLVFAKVPE